jgi:hypothetical protein
MATAEGGREHSLRAVSDTCITHMRRPVCVRAWTAVLMCHHRELLLDGQHAGMAMSSHDTVQFHLQIRCPALHPCTHAQAHTPHREGREDGSQETHAYATNCL